MDHSAQRPGGALVVVTTFTWGADQLVPPTAHRRSVAQAVTGVGEIDLILGQHARCAPASLDRTRAVLGP